jgi:LDH2 family malate/lactate/ureidoglycolate dehydrogenase
MTTTTIPAPSLQAFAAELLAAAGMPLDDAAFCAHCLVQTNLWGIDSHGVLRLPIYAHRLRSRAINPTPAVKMLRGGLGLVVLDGDDGMGFVVGRAAMQRAMRPGARKP